MATPPRAQVRKLEHIIEGLVARRKVTAMIGCRRSLKSWTAVSMAVAVASGRSWMGRAVQQAGALQFFGKHATLSNAPAFAAYLAPLRNSEWVVYSKRPFGGPEEVLRYLARYTHRVAISNRRLVALDDNGVTFKWKDYRLEGRERYGAMTLDTHEFIRRFLMNVLPQGFHRIRYYGLLTSPTRANNIARIRELLAVPLIPIDAIKAATTKPEEPKAPEHLCPCCGGRMHIIETFLPGQQPKHRPTPLPAKIRIDTS
jgi:hypothetical protein